MLDRSYSELLLHVLKVGSIFRIYVVGERHVVVFLFDLVVMVEPMRILDMEDPARSEAAANATLSQCWVPNIVLMA